MNLKETFESTQVYELNCEFDMDVIDKICKSFSKDDGTEKILFMDDMVEREISRYFLMNEITFGKSKLITDNKDFGDAEFIVHTGYTLFFINLDLLNHPLAYEENLGDNKIYILDYEKLNDFSFKIAEAEKTLNI